MNASSNKVLMVLVITLVLIMAISSFPFNKNSAEYEKAKAEISKYIERNYADVLILEEVSYNSKLGGYIGKVSEIDDRRNKSFIAYFAASGDIADDYHYRTKTNMEDELRITIETFITSSGEISAESLQITPLIEIPLFKYTMSDAFDLDIPIELSIEIKGSYSDLEKFSEDAYKILSSLYSSNLLFKTIELYSFVPQGENKSYHFQMEKGKKAYSIEEVKKIAYIKSWEK